MRVTIIFILWIISALSPGPRPAIAGESKPLTIGIVAYRAREATAVRWQPLADYLSAALHGRPVRLQIVDLPGMKQAIAERAIDFALCNPSHFVELRHQYPLSGALATLVDQSPDPVFGGVVLVRSDRDDLRQLADIRGKRVASVALNSLGGYLSQAFELKKIGLDPTQDMQVFFTGVPHDQVVEAVLAGEADVGFVRSGLIETMAGEGRIRLEHLKILEPRSYADFPNRVSTALYPEWPFVSLPHADEEAVRQVAAALLLIEPDGDLTRRLDIRGFTVPADYHSVEELLQVLRLPPFDVAPAFTLGDVWRSYRWTLLSLALAASIVTMLLVRLAVVNRQLRITRGEAEAAGARLKTLFNVLPVGITLVDHGGAIVDCNVAAEQIFGRSRQTLLQKRSSCEEMRAVRRDGMPLDPREYPSARVLTTGREVRDVELGLPAGDATRWLSVNAAPLAPPLSGVAIACVDISGHVAAEAALSQARLTAEEATRAKSDFLASMSHEIRTPLNGVIGMAQLLAFTELTAEQQECLECITISAENLLALINDILDLSKIEADKVELDQSEFSLRRSIDDVVKTQRSRLDQKQLELHIDIPAAVPDLLIGDQLRIKQILLNLLSNAIKFTSVGAIRIVASVRDESTGALRLELAVSDTGIGIDAAAVQKIFQPFVQASGATSRDYGGSGLGLAICRRLAELMGGEITVESTPGVGSTFRLFLPCGVVADACGRRSDRETPAAVLPRWSGAVPRILLVEDNELNRRQAQTLLRKLGLEAMLACNGREALELWQAHDIDLLLMDIQMPELDGREAMQQIRRLEAAGRRRTPIIAVTAYALRGEGERLLGEGFDGYVSKPYQIATLVAEMQRVLGEVERPVAG